jgi:hypothetical protein
MRVLPLFLLGLTLSVGIAQAQRGGNFSGFVDSYAPRPSREDMIVPSTSFFRNAQSRISQHCRPNWGYSRSHASRRPISQNRIDNGRQNAERYDSIFDVEQQFMRRAGFIGILGA